MYEDQTFDVILQRMLSRVPETMDKGEFADLSLHWHQRQWN